VALVVVAAILVSGVAGVGWIMLVGERQEVIAPEPAGGDDASLYRLAAMINDPDGYTTVRADPSTYTAIVARVNAGEVFTTCKLTGAFWQVPTADGVTGYMARSRVRLVRDGFPVPLPRRCMVALAAQAPVMIGQMPPPEQVTARVRSFPIPIHAD